MLKNKISVNFERFPVKTNPFSWQVSVCVFVFLFPLAFFYITLQVTRDLHFTK